MFCRIAELNVEIPEAGGMTSRCREYQIPRPEHVDIVIREDLYRNEYGPEYGDEYIAYWESGRQFFAQILRFRGFYLHASALEYEGRAYLFSGPSTVGKSTHTGLWKSLYGDAVQVINDDKPVLRCVDGQWFAYGAPWCGKDGINQNRKVPLAGVCFLQQAGENRICKLNPAEALPRIMAQTIYRIRTAERMDLLLNLMDDFLRNVPVYLLENRPEEAAARLSRDTMYAGMK